MRGCVVTTPSTAGSREPPADGSEACAAARGHVLLVDDDVELCELLAMRVRANGYRVTVAPGIAATLERLERDRVDMVLLDLDLGADYGFDLLDALVARSPRLPVIVLTASGTADTEAEARRRGAAGFITKPFHHRELLQTISRAVGGARAPDRPSGYF
jgi:two-component system response regulator GlrR